ALLRLRRQYDGARDVLDMDEVHRLLAGSVDDRRFTAKQPVHEMVDDARVIGGRLLTWTVDVEEAQRHPTEAFGALVIAEQILASALGDAIGREWAELIVLVHREFLRIAVDGGARRVDESLDALIGSGRDHVVRTGNIHLDRRI